jgi:type VI secretion system protein ImpF
VTRIPGNQRLLASVFDRLIEIKPNEEATPQNPQSLSLSELQSNVFRDLQAMLNSRQGLAEPLEEGAELRQSVIAFGLPDISNVNPDSLEQQATIRSAVEESIRLFEPRLSNVTVTTEGASQSDRSLRLKVRANLKIEPNPVPVEFDTVIESGTGEWKVRKT